MPQRLFFPHENQKSTYVNLSTRKWYVPIGIGLRKYVLSGISYCYLRGQIASALIFSESYICEL